MRLTPDEIDAIISVLSPYIKITAELKLFGSRVDDAKKGGDIDLLLIVAESTARSEIIYHKPEILGEIKHRIGDQKIDILVTTSTAAKTDAFIQTILPDSISLKQWT
tara:strand:+ start:67297 stop:67617 length:321 start_codon:yes stop_codon:yes gene_type:complete